MLSRREKKLVDLLSASFGPSKDELRLNTPRMYSISCECGEACFGKTGRPVETTVKEHRWRMRLNHPDKSALPEHNTNLGTDSRRAMSPYQIHIYVVPALSQLHGQEGFSLSEQVLKASHLLLAEIRKPPSKAVLLL